MFGVNQHVSTKIRPLMRFFVEDWDRYGKRWLYKGFLIQLAISPMMPRRKASTQTTKITP
jgi:hypothetical protein